MCCLLNFALNVDLTDGLIHFPSLFYFCLFCITQSDIINLSNKHCYIQRDILCLCWRRNL